MYYIVGVMSSLVENLLLYFVVYKCLPHKEKRRIVFIIAAVVESILVLILNQVFESIIFVFAIYLSYEILILDKICTGKIRTKIFVVLLFDCINGIIDVAVYLTANGIYGLKFDTVYDMNLTNTVMSVVSKIILCVVTIIFIGYWKNKEEEIGIRFLLPICMIPAVSILFLIIIFDYSVNVKLEIGKIIILYVITAGLLAINFFLLYIYDELAENEKRRIKVGLMEQQFTYYEELKRSYSRSAAIKHDYEKHLHMISVLLQEKRYEDLKEYVSKADTMSREYKIETYTENIVIDSVLSEKVNKAEKLGISFEIAAEKLGDKVENPIYMCVLCGNALDNAIEACEKIYNERQAYVYIRVKIFREKLIDGDGIVFSVVNSADEIEEKDGELLTSKEDKLQHGYGIKNIEHAVAKMHGTCTYGIENKEFYFVAKIPLNPDNF